VAGRERHRRQLADVPGADDVAAAVGIGADRLDHTLDLVDVTAVRGGPGAPLVAVDGPEVAGGVRPLVPDRDAVRMQPVDVGRTPQEPQQLTEDAAGVQLLGGQQREALGEVEAHLVTEDAARPGAGAVGLLHPVVQHVVDEVEVLPHQSSFSKPWSTGTMARTAWPRWLMASFSSGVSSALVTVLPSATKIGS